jgi:hypothetical protein
MATDAVKQTPKVPEDSSYVEGLSFSGNPSISGTIEVSGGPSQTSSGVSGLYEIVTQRATITYKRVPVLLDMQAQVIDLSGEPSINSTIPGTGTRCKVELTVERTYENGTYPASSFVQSQRFRVLAQAQDQFGNTYGDLSSGGTFTWGPQGRVITEVPYYSRRLVNQGQATLSTGVSSITRYNVAFKNAHEIHGGNAATQDVENHWYDSLNCTTAGQPCGFQGARWVTPFWAAGAWGYYIHGGYNIARETDVQAMMSVDLLCFQTVRGRYFDQRPPLRDPSQRELSEPMPERETPGFVGFEVYDYLRHDWHQP